MKYRMPAEWEPHLGTWIAWPHNTEHWPGKFEPIPRVYVEIVRALLDGGEKVFIEVNDAEMQLQAGALLNFHGVKMPSEQVQFFDIPTNASWTRDHGPSFVLGPRGLTLIDWIFNCWGGKYPPWDLDDAVPIEIAKKFNLPLEQPGIVLEGGAIDVNGKGTLITTESCLLNKNRNPQMSKSQIESSLRDFLGATNVIWLKEGIEGDDTDGHIDDIARFVNPTTVVCAFEEDRSSPNHEILKDCFERLKSARDQNDRPLHVERLPMPASVVYKGQVLPASYANFYIANKAVLLPTFRCPQDRIAHDTLQQLFPDRRVIDIDCFDLVWGLGTLHCSTQQMPR